MILPAANPAPVHPAVLPLHEVQLTPKLAALIRDSEAGYSTTPPEAKSETDETKPIAIESEETKPISFRLAETKPISPESAPESAGTKPISAGQDQKRAETKPIRSPKTPNAPGTNPN